MRQEASPPVACIVPRYLTYAAGYVTQLRLQRRPGRAVRLPFNLEPPLRSYLDAAFPLGIISAGRELRGAFWHSQIQLYFPAEKLTQAGRDARVLLMFPLRVKNYCALGYLEAKDVYHPWAASPDQLVDGLF